MTDGTLVMPTQGRDETGLPFSNLHVEQRPWTIVGTCESS